MTCADGEVYILHQAEIETDMYRTWRNFDQPVKSQELDLQQHCIECSKIVFLYSNGTKPRDTDIALHVNAFRHILEETKFLESAQCRPEAYIAGPRHFLGPAHGVLKLVFSYVDRGTTEESETRNMV